MLRLTINNIDAELYENAPVNLKLRYSDIQNINSATGSYTQTFRLPLTQHNRTIFGNIDEMGLRGGLNLQQKLSASLHSGSLPLLTGYVQVKNIYMTKEHYAEVEVAFFSGTLDLKTELGGSMLSDLNLSAYDHSLTSSVVQQSWIGTGIGPEVRYMIMDKGSNWSSPTNPIGTTANPLPLSVFNPAIRAKSLVDAIMADAGFTYESTYLNSSDFLDIYMPCWNGQINTVGEDVDNEDLRATLSTANQSITGGNSANLNLSDTLAGCRDAGNNYATASDEYTAPFAGLYTVRVTYSWSFSGAAGTDASRLRVIINGTEYETYDIAFGSQQTNAYWEVANIYMDTGDVLRVNAFNLNVSGGTITFLGSSNYSEGTRTSLEIEVVARLGSYDVNINDNLPVMKQIDFLTSLQKMFNLVFVEDKNKPNHLIIDTYENYVSSGSNRDWTNKVDYSKDVVISPTTDLQSSIYEWSYTDGMDFLSVEIQNSLDRVYGRYKVIETENDFATGTLTIQPQFAPFILSVIPGTSNPIYRGLTTDGTGISNPLPMLAYWCGLSTQLGSFEIIDETGTVVTITTTPYFSNYDTDNPVITDNDLNYGVEKALYPIDVNPRDTLYIRFWAQYVKELYSSDARIMKCHVRLNEADLAALEFNDVIFIRNEAYRLLSLSYDANDPSTASAELILKLDDISLCADIPTYYWTAQNTILFNGSNPGLPDYGSQACCEFYGYRWDTNKSTGNRCRPQNIQLTT